jgi:asparagine synthase (glutamine-hydrolysing)
MISDVPIGVFLSEGIDSSLLVALRARHSEQSVRTFSCAFADIPSDESHIAKQVVSQFGTDHVVLRAEGVGSKALWDLIGRLDEPFADPAVIPTLALSKMPASHVRVALSSDGVDEVFGGYPKDLQRRDPYPALPFSFILHKVLCVIP